MRRPSAVPPRRYPTHPRGSAQIDRSPSSAPFATASTGWCDSDRSRTNADSTPIAPRRPAHAHSSVSATGSAGGPVGRPVDSRDAVGLVRARAIRGCSGCAPRRRQGAGHAARDAAEASRRCACRSRHRRGPSPLVDRTSTTPAAQLEQRDIERATSQVRSPPANTACPAPRSAAPTGVASVPKHILSGMRRRADRTLPHSFR